MDILDFIEKTNQSANTVDLFNVYKTALSRLGFDRIVFTLVTDHPDLELKKKHGVFSSYPEEWFTHYTEKNYFNIDPVVSYITATDTLFDWSIFTEQFQLTARQILLLNEAEDATLYNGFAIPLKGANGVLAAVGIASSDKSLKPNKTTKSLLYLMAQQFYACYTSLERKKEIPAPIKLSAREQETLKWSAHGKTRWEIGNILNISENTVSFHTKNSLQKLEASNITMAVIKAVKMGLIQV